MIMTPTDLKVEFADEFGLQFLTVLEGTTKNIQPSIKDRYIEYLENRVLKFINDVELSKKEGKETPSGTSH